MKPQLINLKQKLEEALKYLEEVIKLSTDKVEKEDE